MQGDCFEVRDHVGEPADLSAAGGGFDEIQQSRPAHEAVEHRVRLVENGPQVLERVLVPPIADCCGAPGKVRGREQWSPFMASNARSGSARTDSMSGSVPRNAVARAPTSSAV